MLKSQTCRLEARSWRVKRFRVPCRQPGLIRVRANKSFTKTKRSAINSCGGGEFICARKSSVYGSTNSPRGRIGQQKIRSHARGCVFKYIFLIKTTKCVTQRTAAAVYLFDKHACLVLALSLQAQFTCYVAYVLTTECELWTIQRSMCTYFNKCVIVLIKSVTFIKITLYFQVNERLCFFFFLVFSFFTRALLNVIAV